MTQDVNGRGLYKKYRSWSDQFIPNIRAIIGMQFVAVASDEEDMKHATDLMTFTAQMPNNLRVAARVRKHEYFAKWPYQFTVRYSLPNKAKTEHAKIVEGFGDWMLYAHARENVARFQAWSILNLDVFRDEIRYGLVAPEIRRNPDGTTFAAYDIQSFSPALVVASYGFKGSVPF